MNTYKSMVLHDFSDGVRTHCETGRTDCKYRNTLDMIKSQLNVMFANEVLKSQMTELSWLCVHPCSIEGVLSTDNTVLSKNGTRTNVHEQIIRSECTQLQNFMQHFGVRNKHRNKNYRPFVCLPFNFISCTSTKFHFQ